MHLSRRLPRDQSVYKHSGTTGVKRFVTHLFQNVRIGLVAIQQMAFKSASINRLTTNAQYSFWLPEEKSVYYP